MSRRLDRAFFAQHPVACARALLGCVLVRGTRRAVVVETEAYCAEGDPACHTASRPSARAFLAAHPAGAAYVYFNYGMHWMLNVVVKGEREGFVLLRAAEPVAGLAVMARARGTRDPHALCRGPGNLARAFGISRRHHGHDLCESDEIGFWEGQPPWEIWVGARVGISAGQDLPWRFCAAGHPCVSRPRPAP